MPSPMNRGKGDHGVVEAGWYQHSNQMKRSKAPQNDSKNNIINPVILSLTEFLYSSRADVQPASASFVGTFPRFMGEGFV